MDTTTTSKTDRYNIFSAAARANPQAIYEKMRVEEPVYESIAPFSGANIWILTRYDDCVAMLKDAQIGKEIIKHLPPEVAEKFTPPSEAIQTIDRHLLNIDPPDHTRLRSLIHKAFTPRIVENLRPRIQQIADGLIEKVSRQGHMDLIADFAFPLPITVIAELLGIPVDDQDKFREWTQQLLFGRDQKQVEQSAIEFIMYMNTMIEARREDPKDDLISGLVHVKEGEQQLDQQELNSMIFLLLAAGHETTVNLIGNGTLALLDHPDQMEKLRSNPNLIQSAVEEMLRYNGPVETTTIRWAFADTRFGDKTIKTGDMVLAALLAANRDPAQFPTPNSFDITREPNRHIAFGQGIHFCVGAPLARLEGSIAINKLLRSLPQLRLQAGMRDKLEWNDSILLHGMKSLPLEF